MQLSKIKMGDRVQVNHQGRKTKATVTGFEGRLVLIEPDDRRFTWRRVPAREITDVISTSWNPNQAVAR